MGNAGRALVAAVALVVTLAAQLVNGDMEHYTMKDLNYGLKLGIPTERSMCVGPRGYNSMVWGANDFAGSAGKQERHFGWDATPGSSPW